MPNKARNLLVSTCFMLTALSAAPTSEIIPTIFPRGVATVDGSFAFVQNTNDTVEAIDLRDGSLLWGNREEVSSHNCSPGYSCLRPLITGQLNVFGLANERRFTRV